MLKTGFPLPSFFKKFRLDLAVDLLVQVAIFLYIADYFTPTLLLSRVTTTGGDTASHFYTAKYLREVLLPSKSILGWMQGNYAGFPVFQFYFPFPFLLMVFLSWFTGLQIAFKLISVLGTFLLPLCVYWAFRLLRFPFPVPSLGALATLPFLFMEANSMWGGNIPSTLAGEFTYSLGLALMILFAGSCYRGLTGQRYLIPNALLLAMVGFSHGYTILFAVAFSIYYLLALPETKKNLVYLSKVFSLSFALIGFWIVPLFSFSGFTTRYNFIWVINSWKEILPQILWPFAVLAALLLAYKLVRLAVPQWREGFDYPVGLLFFIMGLSYLFYLIAFRIHVVDIRFLPFLQLSICLVGAVAIGLPITRLRANWIFPLIMTAAFIYWTESHVTFIHQWISWNYSGFEGKSLWNAFSGVNQSLQGDQNDPRVVYEHSEEHNAAGTIRAFESLPLFSGRNTLEGLYMQSSISSPFIFYLQSEISKVTSCPLPDYHCSTLNLPRAVEHLRLFNVRNFIVRSDAVKQAVRQVPDFVQAGTFPPYEVWQLKDSSPRYVTPLRYRPSILDTQDWKADFYNWFKRPGTSESHLVHLFSSSSMNAERFPQRFTSLPLSIPKEVLSAEGVEVTEKILPQEIRITTNRVGHPLLIKISYHPRWKVEGADAIYLASPSFMLIYPTQRDVRLTFGGTPSVYFGYLLTLLGWTAILMVLVPLRYRPSIAPQWNRLYGKSASLQKSQRFLEKSFHWIESQRHWLAPAILAAVVAWTLIFAHIMQQTDPSVLYNQGLDLFTQQQYGRASDLFLRAMKSNPNSSSAINAHYYYAICAFKQTQFQSTMEIFRQMVSLYPDSIYVPEALYHVGLCLENLGRRPEAEAQFREVILKYPGSPWAGHSQNRLTLPGGSPAVSPIPNSAGSVVASTPGPVADYQAALRLFDQGRFLEADEALTAFLKKYPDDYQADSAFMHHCFSLFKRQKWQESLQEFRTMVQKYPTSVWGSEARYHIGMCLTNQGKADEARSQFEEIVRLNQDSRWVSFAQMRLEEMKKK